MSNKIILEVPPLLYKYYNSNLGERVEKMLNKEGIYYHITKFNKSYNLLLKKDIELKTHLGDFNGIDGVISFIKKVKKIKEKV
jgi:hypothetical protein